MYWKKELKSKAPFIPMMIVGSVFTTVWLGVGSWQAVWLWVLILATGIGPVAAGIWGLVNVCRHNKKIEKMYKQSVEEGVSYEAVKATYDTEIDREKRKQKLRKLKIILICAGAVLVVAVGVSVLCVKMAPRINVNRATKAYESGDYAKAIQYYEKSGLQAAGENIHFYDHCLGMVELENGNYSQAIFYLDSVKNVVDVSEVLPETYYKYGMQLFEQEEYDSAKAKFEQAGDYPDAANYLTACDLMKAEKLLAEGALNAAKSVYAGLPQEYSFNGLSVSSRLNQLNNLSAFTSICGAWKSTKNYIESRNVYKRTGSWDSWYYDSNISDQVLNIRCEINDDGTVNICGFVSFYRFTNYSTLKDYCKATSHTVFFNIKNVTKVPSSYAIDGSTTLKYSGGVFSLSYSVKDNYSANFYNLYSSSVTFGALDAYH